MALVQDDHVVQAFAAETPDEALHVQILPRTPRGDHDFLESHTAPALSKRGPVHAVAIAQQIPRGLVPREGFHVLLRGLLRRRVFGDVEMHNAAPFMGQDDQDTEHRVSHRGDDQDIQSDQVLHVIPEKRLPRG